MVSKWAKIAGEHSLPSDAARLLDFYKELHDSTGGLVTPLIGKAMEQAGYDADYSLKPEKLDAVLEWEKAIKLSPEKLIVKSPVLLDFGAAGKGYLVDIIAHCKPQETGSFPTREKILQQEQIQNIGNQSLKSVRKKEVLIGYKMLRGRL